MKAPEVFDERAVARWLVAEHATEVEFMSVIEMVTDHYPEVDVDDDSLRRIHDLAVQARVKVFLADEEG